MLYILVAVVIPLLPETVGRIRNWMDSKEQRKKCKEYRGYVLGEIVDAEAQERPNANLIFDMLNRNVGYKAMLGDDEFAYCNYRLKQKLMVPCKEIANGTPKPGDKMIYKYDYYYIK